MPNFFSGLTGALTAARTGQLEGQNQGALERFALQMQLANMARANRAQDIADAAEQARAGYYANESARNDTIQRRQDALAGIRPGKTATGQDVTDATSGLSDFGAPTPQVAPTQPLEEAGTATGETDEQGQPIVAPVTQLGHGEVYDPSQNLQQQLTTQKLEAAMERQRARDAAAQTRKESGPRGTDTEDAKAASRLLFQRSTIYLHPQVDRVSGIYKPPMSAADATRQAKIDVIQVYPAVARRMWGGDPDYPQLVAAAMQGRQAQGKPTGAPKAAPGAGITAPIPGVPTAPPTAGIPGVPTAPIQPTGAMGGMDPVAAAVAHIRANPQDILALDASTKLTPAQKAEVRRQVEQEVPPQ